MKKYLDKKEQKYFMFERCFMKSSLKAIGVLAIVSIMINIIILIIILATETKVHSAFIGAYEGFLLFFLIIELILPLVLFIMGIVVLANKKPPAARGLYIATGVLCVVGLFSGLFLFLNLLFYIPITILAFLAVNKTDEEENNPAKPMLPPNDIPYAELQASQSAYDHF